MGDRCCTSLMIILFLTVLFKSFHARDVHNLGSGNMNLNYDDCSAASVAKRINNAGDADVFIRYGVCNPSSVAYSIYSMGSGNTYITFGDNSGSSMDEPSNANYGSDQWADNIYNLGNGALRIKYRNCCSSTSSRAQNIYNQGSGYLDVNYGTCSSANSRIAQDVYNLGSGNIRIVYRNCSSSNPVRTVNIHGNGDVIITYANCRSYPPRIVNVGSGKCIIKCQNNRVPRNTNSETTRNLQQIEYNRESVPDASETGPSSQEVKEEGFPLKRTPKRK